MTYSQRYFGGSNNGLADGLFSGSQTVGNFINGNFDRPMHKIKGAIPDFDENRTMPLRLWEIIEINWKDFAQYIGPLQNFGWSFNPGLYDARLALEKEIENLKTKIAADQETLKKENVKLKECDAKEAENQAIMDKLTAKLLRVLGVEDTHPENLKGSPQQSEFASTGEFSATIAGMTARLEGCKVKTREQQAIVDALEAQITADGTKLSDLETKHATDFAKYPTDQLGLTDTFMHAVYTQFLKHFWAYNLGQTNPELWCLLVNDFFGNELPMLYKAAMVLANSKDFSSAQWQEGGGSSTNVTNGSSSTDTSSFGDTTGASQNGSIGASTNTPQNRMALNARNTDFASNVQNQENTAQESSSNANLMNQDTKNSNLNTMNSVNNGKQWQIDPLTVWDRVLQEEGYFGVLWEKAWDFGLFDATM